MDRLEFCMDFKYFAKQATVFSGKITIKICIYIQKSYFTMVSKTQADCFKKKICIQKKQICKILKYQYQCSRYKNKIQTNSIHFPLKQVLQKVIYRSYTSNSSSCSSQTSTCQVVRPPCASFSISRAEARSAPPAVEVLLFNSCRSCLDRF